MKNNRISFYSYVAVDAAGKKRRGLIEAQFLEEAKQKLQAQKLFVVSINESSKFIKSLNVEIGGYPKIRDLSVFCRQFVSLVHSGVSITSTFQMLEEQTENKRLKKAISEIRVDIEKGGALATAMEKHKRIFPKLMISMMAAGEASGNLDIVMERVAKQLERTNKTQGLIKKAMIYPTIVFAVGIVVTIAMLMYVIPAFQDIFDTVGTDLPKITVAYVNMSNALRSYWFIIFPIIALLIFGGVAFGRTNPGKHVYGKIAMSLPISKNLTVKNACSQFARTMSTLLSSGMRLVDAIVLSAETVSNIWFREALINASKQVVLGVPLSKPLEEGKLFPPMVYHMLKVGEEAGNTEAMLDQLADYYDEEVELAVQAFLAAMEPLIIILLAIIVGSLIAACMAPMVSLYEALDKI